MANRQKINKIIRTKDTIAYIEIEQQSNKFLRISIDLKNILISYRNIIYKDRKSPQFHKLIRIADLNIYTKFYFPS